MPETTTDQESPRKLRLSRRSFFQAGHDSFKVAPSQDIDLFETFENFLLSIDGSLHKRWGMARFDSNVDIQADIFAEYRRDDGSKNRLLLAGDDSGTIKVKSANASGAVKNTSIFTVTSTTDTPRVAVSRDFGYFATGDSSDRVKWNGSDFTADTAITTAFQVDDPDGTPVYVDETTDINDAGANDVDPWPAAEAIGDRLLIGYTATFNNLKVNVGTAGIGGTLTWKYWNGSAWTALSSVVDWTTGFTVAGTNQVSWSTPSNWTAVVINGSASLFWVAAEVLTTYSTNPIITQAWIAEGATSWGFSAPTTAPSASASGTASMTITAFRDYTVAFMNRVTGHISDFGPFRRVEKFSNKAQVDLTSVPTGSSTEGGKTTGINRRLILATSDGGPRTRLYLVGTVDDNSTTTFTDTVAEATLLTKDVYAEIGQSDGLRHGIVDNARPPSTGKYPIKHRGRLFLLDGRKLRFSKNIEEVSTSSAFELGGRYEEAWPADYEIDVSAIAQDPVGLLSDGVFLYILAKSGLYRLQGDGPLTFRPPELVFRYLGVVSQDAIDVVYRGGVPVGFVWVTPDKQIVFSDGSTYENITWPVKTEMDGIPEANLGNIRVKYASYAGHNMCLIAIPEVSVNPPTLILAFHLDLARWARFRFPATQEVTAFHFWNNPTTNLPQVLWGIDDEKVYTFEEDNSTDLTSADATTGITSTATTSWQHFDSPAVRKKLQEMEVDGDTTDLLLSVYGASFGTEFGSPSTIVSDTTAAAGFFGEFKVPLAVLGTVDRFYRVRFKVTANNTAATPMLRSYSITAVPVHAN